MMTVKENFHKLSIVGVDIFFKELEISGETGVAKTLLLNGSVYKKCTGSAGAELTVRGKMLKDDAPLIQKLCLAFGIGPMNIAIDGEEYDHMVLKKLDIRFAPQALLGDFEIRLVNVNE